MTILDRIVSDTHQRVSRAQRTRPLQIPNTTGPPTRSLEKALRQNGLSIIAEIKKKSPSQSMLHEDISTSDLARDYTTAGADAISVLTEPQHFGGSLYDLSQARQHTSLPLLRKDFIVDPYQIAEAHTYGAHAILLIAAILDSAQLRDYQQMAHACNLECLVEVYEEQELDKLDFDLVRILGVNNRDLRTFEVNIDHSVRVFQYAPDHVVQVSESGLQTANDLLYLSERGIDAVLIGGSLMAQSCPGHALKKLKDSLFHATTS